MITKTQRKAGKFCKRLKGACGDESGGGKIPCQNAGGRGEIVMTDEEEEVLGRFTSKLERWSKQRKEAVETLRASGSVVE